MDISELAKRTAERLDLDVDIVDKVLEAAQTIIGEYERAREQQAQAAMDKIGQAIHDAFCPCGTGEASHTADDGDQDQDVAGDQEAAPATT